jgi:hypothetical protein
MASVTAGARTGFKIDSHMGDGYQMPIPESGLVYWLNDPGSRERSIALVVGIGSRSIDVLVFTPTFRNGLLRQNVRHTSDPDYARMIDKFGVFELTDFELKVRSIIENKENLDT